MDDDTIEIDGDLHRMTGRPFYSGADWEVVADELVQVHLSLALCRHVLGWPGATDEQLYAVSQQIIDARDNTPRAKK